MKIEIFILELNPEMIRNLHYNNIEIESLKIKSNYILHLIISGKKSDLFFFLLDNKYLDSKKNTSDLLNELESFIYS